MILMFSWLGPYPQSDVCGAALFQFGALWLTYTGGTSKFLRLRESATLPAASPSAEM